MLCADISHKILRTDTVLDLFYDLQGAPGNFHDNATKAVVGEIVLTRCVRLYSRIILKNLFQH